MIVDAPHVHPYAEGFFIGITVLAGAPCPPMQRIFLIAFHATAGRTSRIGALGLRMGNSGH